MIIFYVRKFIATARVHSYDISIVYCFFFVVIEEFI